MDANLNVAKGMMKAYGMHIDCMTSGQEAINAIRAEKVRYNAIFMDHMMPEMDGMEATRIIREEIGTEYAKTVPIIALTANAIVGTEQMFLSNGFQAFLPKPIEIANLDLIIREYVWDRELEKMLEQLKIDINKGFERFDGDMESYIQVLHSFASYTRPLLENMKNVTREKLNEYAIAVHGIKGSSYGICAAELGDRAGELEKAAKDGKMEYITASNGVFIEDLENFLVVLDNMLNRMALKSKKTKKNKPDGEVLGKLLKACNTYDMDGVDAAMAEIEHYEYEADSGLAAWLRKNVDKMDFAQIKERLSAYSTNGEKNG
jgi:CheY-like chemotaxis protein